MSMPAFKYRVTTIIFICVATASALGYLALFLFQEFRGIFASKPPKVLVMQDSLQCLVGDHNDNPNKLLFVSCSGFYDEE